MPDWISQEPMKACGMVEPLTSACHEQHAPILQFHPKTKVCSSMIIGWVLQHQSKAAKYLQHSRVLVKTMAWGALGSNFQKGCAFNYHENVNLWRLNSDNNCFESNVQTSDYLKYTIISRVGRSLISKRIFGAYDPHFNTEQQQQLKGSFPLSKRSLQYSRQI